MNEVNDPLIGLTVTGTYVIRSKLAEGGMGAVYLATNDLGNRKIVKTLLPHANLVPQIRERFDREGRAAARLNGRPHIVAIDDVGTLPNGQQFLTMEYLHGQTLEAHMQKHGRVSAHHAFMIVVQIARGLHELHSAQLIHRDLKPGNVFLVRDRADPPYHVVLIDLGIAHDATLINDPKLRTHDGASMGTPGYMAPEQFGDAGSVTPAADIYALAIILYEMLVGVRPWNAPSMAVLYHLQQTQPPTIPAELQLPGRWRDIILGSLAKQPSARPQSAYAFVSALASDLHGDDRIGVQSGAQMMASFARSMINQAPVDSETIRGPQLGPMMWTPPRLTQGSSPSFDAPPPSNAPSGQPSVETVSHRPQPVAARSAGPSTLSASSGVIEQAPAPARTRWLLPVLAASVLAATGLVFAVARMVRSPDSTHASEAVRDLDASAGTTDDATQIALAPASATIDASVPATVSIDAEVVASAPVDAASNAPTPVDAAMAPSIDAVWCFPSRG